MAVSVVGTAAVLMLLMVVSASVASAVALVSSSNSALSCWVSALKLSPVTHCMTMLMSLEIEKAVSEVGMAGREGESPSGKFDRLKSVGCLVLKSINEE